MKIEKIKTELLIIGGGTAGCYAALTASEKSDVKILICEKANIKRSGCLAAGVNALNAYIVEGRTMLITPKRMQTESCVRIYFIRCPSDSMQSQKD